jgi:hypothetical protein
MACQYSVLEPMKHKASGEWPTGSLDHLGQFNNYVFLW